MASKSNKASDQPSAKERALQHDRPSATNRAWGASDDPGDQSFGHPEQGGYGDFRRIRDIDDAPVMDAPRAQARDEGAARGADARDGNRRPDDRLREAVADRLDAEHALDANQVLVAAEDGVVTLTGEVHEAWMKDCAEDVARTVTGVREVRNVVRCDDGSASFGPPGEAVRSGHDQRGSAFSSSSKVVDAARGTHADWPNDVPLPAATRTGRNDR